MTRPRTRYDPTAYRVGHCLAEDLAHLAAGHETGFYDEHGRPAPWPPDFFEPRSGWQPTGGTHNTNPPDQDQQPF